MADKQTRLTDAQKKSNHIESERKRREAIREGFDRLAEIVPGMEGQGRSEAVVLQNTVQFLRNEKNKRSEYKEAALKSGMSEADFESIYKRATEDNKAAAAARAGTAMSMSGNETGGSMPSGPGGPIAHSGAHPNNGGGFNPGYTSAGYPRSGVPGPYGGFGPFDYGPGGGSA